MEFWGGGGGPPRGPPPPPPPGYAIQHVHAALGFSLSSYDGYYRLLGSSSNECWWKAATQTIMKIDRLATPLKINDTTNVHAFLDVAIFSQAHLAIRHTSLFITGFPPVGIKVHALKYGTCKGEKPRVIFVHIQLTAIILELSS